MTTRSALAALGALALGVLALLLWLPPEQTLGAVIRPVFLHGALVRVGLLLFAAAGLMGLLYLLQRRSDLLAWCMAAQESAIALWLVYTASSAITTKLAWDQWIAWDEPRVRASIHVLWFSVAAWLVARWVGSGIFTALANVAVAALTWMLIRSAGIIRHPFDPIGTSGSQLYGVIYWLLVIVLGTMAVVLVVWRREHLGRQLTHTSLSGSEAASHSATGRV